MNNIENVEFMTCKENELPSTSNYTLPGALHRIMVVSTASNLKRNLYNSECQADGELEYVTSRLGVSEDVAILFSILCEKGAWRRVSLYDIGQHLGCGILEMLLHKPSIALLVECGLVVEESLNRYFVPDEVLSAISRNELWSDEVRAYASDGELYHDMYEHFVLAAGNHISKITMYKRVHRLIEANAHLRFVKAVVRYSALLDEDELMFLLSLSCIWLVKGNLCMPFKNAASVLKDNVSANKALANLLNGSSPLLTEGIIKPHKADSFATKQGFSLTTETRRQLKPESELDEDPLAYLMKSADLFDPPQKAPEEFSQLLFPDKITKRPLFYNETTAHQIEELATLLNEKKMRNVLRRLKRSNLRCGFACLFHGGPGTGKTETVLQLARRTGRAVFRVEVSELRTKWHGESEKLVKGVFDEYRQAAAKAELAPIMLFNEADAIFSRRSETPEQASDKCENAIQNIILQEMETLDGILIATTNLATNLDKAFERRFLYKVEFETPDSNTRAKIWRSLMPSLDSGKARTLAEQFPNLAGGHIENIARKATISRVIHGRGTGWDGLTELCRHELLDSQKNRVIGFRATAQ